MQHYRQRFADIFNYTSRKWWYIVLKTLCIIIGLPLYIVLIPVDLVVFVIYVLFSWIPFLNAIFLTACRMLNIVFAVGYYIAICIDAPMYIARLKQGDTLQQEATQEAQSDISHSTDTVEQEEESL